MGFLALRSEDEEEFQMRTECDFSIISVERERLFHRARCGGRETRLLSLESSCAVVVRRMYR